MKPFCIISLPLSKLYLVKWFTKEINIAFALSDEINMPV